MLRNTFVLESGIDQEMYKLLEGYDNPKIVVTNANDEQIIQLGMEDLLYKLVKDNFLSINPDFMV